MSDKWTIQLTYVITNDQPLDIIDDFLFSSILASFKEFYSLLSNQRLGHTRRGTNEILIFHADVKAISLEKAVISLDNLAQSVLKKHLAPRSIDVYAMSQRELLNPNYLLTQLALNS